MGPQWISNVCGKLAAFLMVGVTEMLVVSQYVLPFYYDNRGPTFCLHRSPSRIDTIFSVSLAARYGRIPVLANGT